MNIWKKNKEKRATEKHSRNSSADLGAFAPVLGVPLTQALVNSKCYDGHPVPALLRQCIDYVTEYGLHVEGIYRVSSTKPRLDELERMANAGEPFCFTDPHDAAGLLKRFLRQLPEHVLTNAARVQFESAGAKCKCEGLEPCRCDSVREIKQLLRLLPSENYYLLAYVFLHSQRVVQEQRHNKMNLAALGVLLQAMMNLSQKEVRIFLLNASDALASDAKEPLVQLFDDVEIKPYRRPRTIDELKVELPESEEGIRQELLLQENLLQDLSQHVDRLRSQGQDARLKEHALWDVQTGITLLKRKLKAAGDEPENIAPVEPINHLEDNNVNPAFLEKQLLAVHTTLKEEIAEEKRKITQLLSRLRQVHSQLPPEAVQQLAAMRQQPQRPADDARAVEECQREETRRDEQLDEITRLRDLCAELRARLEHDTVLLSSSATADAPAMENGNGSLLVTRF